MPADFAPDRGLTKTFLGRAGYTIDTNRSVALQTVVRQNGAGMYVKPEYTQAFGQHWRVTAGFAPQVRIGVHAAGATQVGTNFTGKGVHEAARIAALAEGSEIIASRETAAGGRFPISEPRTVDIRGMAEPIEVLSVQWK